MKHPIQPLERDERGVLRFKANAIVRYLLDNGGIDLNHLATKNFSQEDSEQFAQLIGYSLTGAADLRYFSDATYDAAQRMADAGLTEDQARIASLESMIEAVRAGLRSVVTAVFRIHPDDLTT